MPRRPRPVLYAEAMAALHDAYLTLRDMLQARISREQLELLRDRLELLVSRDNGRRRFPTPPHNPRPAQARPPGLDRRVGARLRPRSHLVAPRRPAPAGRMAATVSPARARRVPGRG